MPICHKLDHCCDGLKCCNRVAAFLATSFSTYSNSNTLLIFIVIMHWDSWVKGTWNHHDNSYTVTYFHSHLQGSGVAGDPCHLTFIYLTKGSVAQTPGQTREDKKVLLQSTHIITLWTQLTEWAHNFHGSVTGRTGYWQYAGDQTLVRSSRTYIIFN